LSNFFFAKFFKIKKMKIGGIQKMTLLDFPDKISAVIFAAGCNFRCGFCHNPEFVLPEKIRALEKFLIPEKKILNFLDSRKNFLDGVVVSGGEPTLQKNLIPFLRKIRAKNFLIKLDTNGSRPEILEKIFAENLVDFVAMDIKNSPENYDEICGTKIDFAAIEKSKNLILQNKKIAHEFRTTVVRGFHDAKNFKKICEFCNGAKKFSIQNFRPQKTLQKNFEKIVPFSDSEILEFEKIAQKFFKNVRIF